MNHTDTQAPATAGQLKGQLKIDTFNPAGCTGFGYVTGALSPKLPADRGFERVVLGDRQLCHDAAHHSRTTDVSTSAACSTSRTAG